MAKEVSVFLVTIIMVAFSCLYTVQVWKRKIVPTLSTWVIFALGTGLSLVTYITQKYEYDFRAGVLNMMDFVAVMVVLIAIIARGNRRLRFKPFETWYLAGATVIIGYWLLWGDAFGSNILTQVLISVGYIPTVQNLWQEKKNTESFIGWGCGVFAGIVALYPAMVDGDQLAIVYSARTIILASCILGMMVYYELRSSNTTE